MTSLTLSQGFALLALNGQDSDRMTVAKRVALRCIAAGAVIELCLDRDIAPDAPFPLAPGDGTLTPAQDSALCALLKTPGTDMALDLAARTVRLHDHALASVERAFYDSLAAEHLLECIPSLLSCDMFIHEAGLTYHEYRAEETAYRGTAEALRAEILEDGPITDDALVMLWLLRESGALRDLLAEEELPHAADRMQQAYRDTALGRALMLLQVHKGAERSVKKLLADSKRAFSKDFGLGLNFLCPLFDRSHSVFIDVEGMEKADARIRDIRNRLELLGHRWEMVREGRVPLVRIDNVLYECVPEGVPIGTVGIRVPVYGVRLRRYPLFL